MKVDNVNLQAIDLIPYVYLNYKTGKVFAERCLATGCNLFIIDGNIRKKYNPEEKLKDGMALAVVTDENEFCFYIRKTWGRKPKANS